MNLSPGLLAILAALGLIAIVTIWALFAGRDLEKHSRAERLRSAARRRARLGSIDELYTEPLALWWLPCTKDAEGQHEWLAAQSVDMLWHVCAKCGASTRDVASKS